MSASARRSPLEWLKKRMWRWYDSVGKRLLPPLFRLAIRLGWERRFVVFETLAIGHLAIEPDLFIKEARLGWRPEFKPIVITRTQVANRHLLEYWAKLLPLLRSPLLCRLAMPLARDPVAGFPTRPYVKQVQETALAMRIQTAWAERPPLLSLSVADRVRGRAQLAKLGMPEDAWFVVLHCRESGYWGNEQQSFRDGDIVSFSAAARAIAERGGWTVRLGNPSMKALPELPNTIDYAHLELRSEWMDVFLCAEARGSLGDTSGLPLISTVFGVPIALANLIPMVDLPLRPGDLGIPKRLHDEQKGRDLTFREILDSEVFRMRRSDDYVDAGLKIVDNTPDEILDLALELLEVAERRVDYTADDERRQERFRSLLRPGHYCYGAPSRVGRDFLREHEALLD